MRDWLVAWDHALREDLKICTNCGQFDPHGWFDVCEVGPLSVAVYQCQHCHNQGPAQEQLQDMLEARYRGWGE